MQSTALPPLLTDLPADERARLLDDAALRHLPAVFAAVPDPRGPQGRRYPLPFLLTCVVRGPTLRLQLDRRDRPVVR